MDGAGGRRVMDKNEINTRMTTEVWGWPIIGIDEPYPKPEPRCNRFGQRLQAERHIVEWPFDAEIDITGYISWNGAEEWRVAFVRDDENREKLHSRVMHQNFATAVCLACLAAVGEGE
jgi:hypothetical protein